MDKSIARADTFDIRRVEEDDWKDIKEIWLDFADSEYSRYDKPHPTDDETVRRMIERWAGTRNGTEHMFFSVCIGSRVVGYVAFHLRPCGYEAGYCFHSGWHGRGIATRSMTELIWRMREIGAKKIIAGTALENLPSVALLGRLGFSLAKTEKVSFYKDGEGRDITFEGGVFELDV